MGFISGTSLGGRPPGTSDLPVGGNIGDVLTKASAADFDALWDPILPQQVAGKLERIGDTALGALLYDISVALIDPQQLVTKQYVDRLASTTAHLIGVINADTGNCRYSPTSGHPDGPLVPPNVAGSGAYLICDFPGNNVPTAPGVFVRMDIGDWIISDGVVWFVLQVGQSNLLASNVGVLPPIDGASNVQTALERMVLRSGDTMTGALTISTADLCLTLSKQSGGAPSPALRIVNVNSGQDAVHVAGGGNVSINDGDFQTGIDGHGLITNAGGRFYKRIGTGVGIRQPSGNQQPFIENNDGSNRREIVDTGTNQAVGGVKTFTEDVFITGTNRGITFTGGSRIYDWTDKPFRICSPRGQPQIANLDGTNIRDIIDTINGDARYALKSEGGGGRANSLNVDLGDPWIDLNVWTNLFSVSFSIPRGGNSWVVILVNYEIYYASGTGANTELVIEWSVTNTSNNTLSYHRRNWAELYSKSNLALYAPVSGNNPTISLSVRRRWANFSQPTRLNTGGGHVLIQDAGPR
jgi:hypothetical protein